MDSTAKNDATPSEYLLARFDAIKEFESSVGKLRSYPVGLVRRWYGDGGLKTLGKPENRKILQACIDLEEVIGIDDPYWHEGKSPFSGVNLGPMP